MIICVKVKEKSLLLELGLALEPEGGLGTPWVGEREHYELRVENACGMFDPC